MDTKKVRSAGFEPATHGLEGRCSIQLSYERINRGDRIRTYGFLLPKQARYQTAPRPESGAPFSGMQKVMQVFYQVFCDTDLQHRLRRTHKAQIKTQITMNTWEDSHRGRKTDKLCPPFFPKKHK